MTGLETRSLGSSDLRVTVLGLGTGTLGGHRVPVSREAADGIVQAAWSAGVRYFDTAPFYGFGQACRIVGDALREMPRDEWVLATKVGRLLRPRADIPADTASRHQMPFDVVFDYSYDGVLRSFEHSLDRHAKFMSSFRKGGYRALEELRSSGRVRAIGIGVNEREVLLEAMEWGVWDAFLLAGRYTLLEQGPLDDLLPRCVRAGISVVIGAPFNTGILAGRESYNFKPPPTQILDRVNAIKAICDSYRVPLIAAALQFPLAHPAVAAILPGPRNVEEFEANLTLLGYPIPAALWADLQEAELLHPDAPTPT